MVEKPPTFLPFYNFTTAIQFGKLLQELKKSLGENLESDALYNIWECLISMFFELNSPYTLHKSSCVHTLLV